MADKKILIALSTAEFARRADFYDHLNILEKPDGCMFSASHGQSPAYNRNVMIEKALENDCTHIFFVDDDMILKPDTLTKLMAHDLDIVCGYYLHRNFPNRGLVFTNEQPDGSNAWHTIEDNQSGLLEVTSTGLGCALFRTGIFLNLEKPWVRLGELKSDEWCDDIGLFNRIRAAGFKIFVDLDCPVGHIASVIVTPEKMNDQWHVTYDTNGTGKVSFPMIKPPVQETV